MLRDMFSFQGIDTTGLTREMTSVTAGVDIQSTGGRDNGPCMRMAGSDSDWGCYVQKTYTAQQTWIFGMRLKANALPTLGTCNFLKFVDGSTTHVQIALDTDGTLKAYRDATLLGSSTNTISADTLYYIEVKVKIDDSVGTVSIKVEGVSWLSLTSQDTRNGGNATANNIYLGPVNNSGGGSNYTYFCDGYIADTQSGQITDFIGPQRCDAKFFTADGFYTAWTPSTGSTRYGVVDDNPANDDTDYATGVVGNNMTVKTFSLGYTPASIYGVKLTGVMKKTASDPVNVKRLMRRNSGDYNSANLTAPDTSYTAISEVLERDLYTGVAFTKSDLEGVIEWGFTVSA